MAVFGGCGGTAAATANFLKVSKNLCQEKTFFFSFLYSENKTKPKNHGLRQSCKTPPPPYITWHYMAYTKNNFFEMVTFTNANQICLVQVKSA